MQEVNINTITEDIVKELALNSIACEKISGCCRCIDGRYENQGATSGLIARPGAHFGYVMALLAVNATDRLWLSPKDCAIRVMDTVYNLSNSFNMHTDNHHPMNSLRTRQGLGEISIGCGHINLSLDPKNQEGYGVKSNEIKQALGYCVEKIHDKDMVELAGEHKEEAVILVKGVIRTVEPRYKDRMFFVYDKKRDELYMEKLVMNLKISGLRTESLIKASEAQLKTTMRLLARKKPVFEVNCDETNPTVSFIGEII